MQSGAESPACCRHLAASEGSYAVCEWLLNSGARIDALDRFKHTPLEVLPQRGMQLHDGGMA